MKIFKIWMAIILSVSFVSASFFGEDMPEEQDIEKALVFEIPTYASVDSIDIEISENTGTKVEPIYTSRFKGVLKINETLYKIKDRVLNKLILEEKIKKGTEIKIYGVTRSELNGDKWNVKFKSLKIPVVRGKILSDFEVGSFVISGSTEEENLKKEKIEQDNKKAEERKIREAKEAEERKIREAKEAEERKIRESKEAKEIKIQKERIESVAGIWKGAYYCGNKSDLILTLKPVGQKIKAIFDFVSGNKSGSFILFGIIDDNYKIEFKPVSWIDRPAGFSMIGLKGQFNEQHDAFFGDTTGSKGCKNFELYKVKK